VSWKEVKKAERDERRSGHRAASVVVRDGGSCWERAQFIALHAELSQAWQPRDGQEEQLIDQMAQFQTLMERWQETLTSYTTAVGRKRRRAEREVPSEGPPRVTQAEAVQGAAAMVEQMHNLYLRSLRALQDRRRASPLVISRQGAAFKALLCGSLRLRSSIGTPVPTFLPDSLEILLCRLLG
jgi:hypothetical protein